MHSLRLLGGISLSDDEGHEVDALLRQPKHIALLAYLALPAPGTWHRRDSMLGTFWPEHDQSHARSALRSALHVLRGHFPEGTIRSRGGDELSLAPEIIRTDAASMSDDFSAGRFESALSQYQGELLPGIYIPDADGFEKWLEDERTRLRTIARKSAAQLSLQEEKNGDIDAAIDAARRAAELEPNDETAARRWIALLDRAGDRAQAFAVYERFRNHMSDAFGVRPSAETIALLDSVRTRRESGLPLPAALAAAASPPQSAPSSDPPAMVRRTVRPRWLWIGAPLAGLTLFSLAFSTQQDAKATVGERTLVVAPMINETGDAALAYLATGIAEGIARRLEGIGGITIRSGARSDLTDSTRQDLGAIGREFGATIVLRSSIHRSGDSLEVRVSVVDARTSEERSVPAHQFSLSSLRDAESTLAARIVGALFRTPVPTTRSSPDTSVDPESYRLTLEGWHQLLLRPVSGKPLEQRHIAAALFTKAVDIDPRNARAWSGLSSVWASQVVIDAIPFDEGYMRATAAAARAISIDSLQGSALANLAIMRALKYKDVAAGADLMRKAEAAEPWNPEVYLIKGLIMRSAHRYDEARDASRVARALDPLSPFFANGVGGVELCAGRPEAALKVYQSDVSLNPSDHQAQAGLTRALAMLGRYDEAIASWRKTAILSGDSALAVILAGTKGKEGYWRVRHAEGRKRLSALEKTKERVTPRAIAQASFAAGDPERGFRELEKARLAGTPSLYRLSCMDQLDEYRNTPQFAQALARIGAIRSK